MHDVSASKILWWKIFSFFKISFLTRPFIIPKKILFLREIAFLITEEKVLNWQSTVIKDNSNTLQRIDGKLDKLVEKIVMTDEKTNTL